MRCFKDKCQEEGTIRDPETPAIFINPEDPKGPKVQPAHCPQHHAEIMGRRADMEASFDRAFRR